MLHEGLESLHPSSPCRGHGSLDLSLNPPRDGFERRVRGLVASWRPDRPVWGWRSVDEVVSAERFDDEPR